MKKNQKTITKIQVPVNPQDQTDREFLKDLTTYQADVLREEAVRLGSGPAVKKAAALFFRARKAERVERAKYATE